MASIIYNSAKEAFLLANAHAKQISWLDDTIKVALVSAEFGTEDPDEEFIGDLPAGWELNATGYTAGFGGAGRLTLGSKTVVKDLVNDRAELDGADSAWPALGGATNDTVAGALLVVERTNDADSQLIAFIDFADFSTNGGTITIQWNAEGILQFS